MIKALRFFAAVLMLGLLFCPAVRAEVLRADLNTFIPGVTTMAEAEKLGLKATADDKNTLLGALKWEDFDLIAVLEFGGDKVKTATFAGSINTSLLSAFVSQMEKQGFVPMLVDFDGASADMTMKAADGEIDKAGCRTTAKNAMERWTEHGSSTFTILFLPENAFDAAITALRKDRNISEKKVFAPFGSERMFALKLQHQKERAFFVSMTIATGMN